MISLMGVIVDFPFMKPCWRGDKEEWSSRKSLSLSLMMCSAALASVESRLIGRYFLLALGPFGIRTNRALFHAIGSEPDSSISLIIFLNTLGCSRRRISTARLGT